MRHFTLISVWLVGKLTNMNNANILRVQHPAKIYIKQFSATPSCQRNSAQRQKKKIYTLYAVTIPRSKKHSILINQFNNFFFWILYNYFFCHICVQRIYPEEAGVGGVFPQLAGHIQIACQLQINTEESEPWPGLARTGLGTFCIINKIKTMLGTLRLLLPGFRSSWIKHPSARNLTGSIYSTE